MGSLKQSSLLQNALERALQVSIEVMIDISERIRALNHMTPLRSAAENMQKLRELGILSGRPEYAEMVKFRNFIVHRYERIDLEILYGILRNKLHLFRHFIAEIREG